MTENELSILCVDDDKVDRQSVVRSIKKSGISYNIKEAATLDEALNIFNEEEIHCVFLDYLMPGTDGLAGVSQLIEKNPYLTIVMVTGQGSETVAVEALKRGAKDYISKDQINADTIKKIIENSVEKSKLQQKIDEQHEQLHNFSRILAHDFNAPINSISNFLDFIKNDLSEGNHNDIPDYLSRIKKSINHMGQLVTTLQHYNKLDDDAVTFKLVSLQEALECALNNIDNEVQTKNAAVSVSKLPDINGHLPQLTQLFQNLISNAIKFCEEQPVLVITSEQQENYWLISIKDNGIGIKPEFLEAVFNPFKRLHGKEKYPGTGLGLALCKKIVERHQGKIWCESQLGAGTTFKVLLS